MAHESVKIQSISFGPENSDGTKFLLVESTFVQIDQMLSEHESATISVGGIASNAISHEGWELVRDRKVNPYVSICVVLDNGAIYTFPKCSHEVDPPTASFRAQDITNNEAGGAGETYWAAFDGKRITGNHRIKFPT